jgi:hypothetical protein
MTDDRRCNGCGELKSPDQFLENIPICRDCGITSCRSCGSGKPGPEFRDPTLDPICRDCEVRHLSDDERATLEREEQDYLKRVKEGQVVGHAEWPEVRARRAALRGVSTRRYKEAESGLGLQTLALFSFYLLSAILVSMIAIWRGVSASPPELLPIPLTILLLVALLFFWLALGGGFYEEIELRIGLTDRDFFPALALGALLLPVVIYVIVLIILP